MSNSDTVLQLPTPAHIQADSMLARRFGKETVNYFGGLSHSFLVAGLKLCVLIYCDRLPIEPPLLPPDGPRLPQRCREAPIHPLRTP